MAEVVDRINANFKQGDTIGRLGGKELGLTLLNVEGSEIITAFDLHRRIVVDQSVVHESV